MDKADDGADGNAIKPDDGPEQLIQQAFPNESGVNNLNITIGGSKQMYTELASHNIISGLTDELLKINFGDEPDPHSDISLREDIPPYALTDQREDIQPFGSTDLREELQPCGSTDLREELQPCGPTSQGEELQPNDLGEPLQPCGHTSQGEELQPNGLRQELHPCGPTSQGEELQPNDLGEQLQPCGPTSQGEELQPNNLTEELKASTSQQLEYIFIYSKTVDDNSKDFTSESCEPNTSDLLEQVDPKPEQIIKEEVEHIFKQALDAGVQTIYGNSQTNFQQTFSFGDTFQDLQFVVKEEPKVMSSTEFFIMPNQSSPVGTSQAALLRTPLDEFTLMDKLDVSGEINVGSSEEVINLGPQLLRIVQNKDNWDIIIFVGNFKFRCHLLALQMYSPYFRRFKTSKTYAVRMPSKWVTPHAFNVVYEWIMLEQSNKLKSFSNRSMLEIYSAAQFLGITELINAVCQSFDRITNEDEIYNLLPDVFQLGIPIFEQLFLSRISRFFLTLVASQEFVEMKARHVRQLLTCQNIGVNSEIEVVYAAVRWLNHDWPQRRVHVPEMMRSVRFCLLPPMFLRFLQSPQKTRVLHEISECPLVIEEINKAFVYTSSTLLYKGPHAVLEFQLPAFEVPEHRKWLYDPQCANHRNLVCDMRQFFTYAQFLQYLETLHHKEPNYWKTLKYVEESVQSCQC